MVNKDKIKNNFLAKKSYGEGPAFKRLLLEG